MHSLLFSYMRFLSRLRIISISVHKANNKKWSIYEMQISQPIITYTWANTIMGSVLSLWINYKSRAQRTRQACSIIQYFNICQWRLHVSEMFVTYCFKWCSFIVVLLCFVRSTSGNENTGEIAATESRRSSSTGNNVKVNGFVLSCAC